MLKPGTYKLTRDVENPSPDRRVKRDWRSLPIWKADSEFLVVEYSRDTDVAALQAAGVADDKIEQILARRNYTVIKFVDGRYSHQYVGPGHEEQYAALEGALEPIEESHDAMFTRLDVGRDYFARWLVESGRLTSRAFETLWGAFQSSDETPMQEQGIQLTSAEIDSPLAVALANRPEREGWFRWTAEFEVTDTWVADGFDLTDERAHAMLANDLSYAYGHELKAKVIARPDDERVAKAMGYQTVEQYRANRGDKQTKRVGIKEGK